MAFQERYLPSWVDLRRRRFDRFRSLAIIAVAMAGAIGMQAALLPAQLSFDPMPEEVQQDAHFPVVIRALTTTGQPAVDANALLRVRAMIRLPELPVISEVDVKTPMVEISNPGEQTLDLSGWELVVGHEDYSAGFVSHAFLRFPPGTVLGAGEVCTVSGTGTAPGAFPAFVTSQGFIRDAVLFTAVRLHDPAGQVQDELHLLANQSSSTLTLWKGTGLKAYGGPQTNVVHSRVGVANHFRSADWVTNLPPSPGRLNAQLTAPWRTRSDWIDPHPATMTLTNGVWAGSVSIPVAAGAAVLVVDNGAGLVGRSPPLRVAGRPGIELVVPDELRNSSESAAGQGRGVTVVLPEAATAGLDVSLTWSADGEFSSAALVHVDAGSRTAAFTVTNLDDPWPDGQASVTLTASAAGYTSAVATLWNDDDESGSMWIDVPSSLAEGRGPVGSAGRVWLDSPARHDVQVALSAEPPVRLPATVLIPQGRSSVTFTVDVGEDSWANPVPYLVEVIARTGSWPRAQAFLELVDNEDHTVSVEPPSAMTEGTPAHGVLRLAAPRATPFVVQLTSLSAPQRARLGWPKDIVIPAGVQMQEFSIEAHDNQTPEIDDVVSVYVTYDGRPLDTGKPVVVMDDDSPLAGAWVGTTRDGAMLSGQPFTLVARLTNAMGGTFSGAKTGRLEVLASPSVAMFAPDPVPVIFTNGAWTGTVTLEGAGLGLQIRLKVDGFETVSQRFDLLMGKEHQISIKDVQWWKRGERLLVLEPFSTNSPARLTELEPLTGLRGRSLTLPGTPALLAVADGGGSAWLSTTSNALMRVDLGAWQLMDQKPLLTGYPQSYAQTLIPVPGQPESVIAVMATNPATGSMFVRRYSDGLAMPAFAAWTPSYKPLTMLVASPSAPLFWCLYWNGLSRFRITESGVALDQTWNTYSAGAFALAGDLLLAGDGRSWDALTGAEQVPFLIPRGSRMCVPEAGNLAAFLSDNAEVVYYDTTARQQVAGHSLPRYALGGALPAATRFMSFGDSGIAVVYGTIGVIHAFQSPALGNAAADLEVTLRAPAEVRLPASPGQPAQVQVEVGITNRGPNVAQGVEWALNDGGFESLGSLGPGEGVSRRTHRGAYEPTLLATRVVARCATPDPTTANNTAEMATAFLRPDVTGTHQLMLGASQLIAATDGTRLFASLSRGAGAVTNAIAVIDPAAGSVVRMLGMPQPSQRMAVTDDGRMLYAGLSNSVLMRWDLTTYSNDLSLQMSPGPLTDLAILPGAPRSVAVVSGKRIGIYDDSQLRPGVFDLPQADARIGLAAGSLWVAQTDVLREFRIGPGGVTLRRTHSFPPPWGVLDFISDGGRLFFKGGAVFDAETGASQVIYSLAGSTCADRALESVYVASGTTLRRLDSTTFGVETEQTLYFAGKYGLDDLVRWGTDGIAARSGAQILMLRSQLITSRVQADLAVNIIQPAQLKPDVPLEWTLVVTNPSSATVSSVELVLHWDPMPDPMEVDWPRVESWFNDRYLHLGEVGPGQVITVHMRGILRTHRNYSLIARVMSAATDPVPANNTATLYPYVNPPTSDLGVVSTSCPFRVAQGREFSVTSVLTNAGPDVVSEVIVGALGDPQLPVTSWEGCVTNEAGSLVLRDMAPGSSRTITVRFIARGAGFRTVLVSPYADRIDGNAANDYVGTALFVEDAASAPGVNVKFPGRGKFAWDPRSRLILAIFEGYHSGVLALDPNTLAPVSQVLPQGNVDDIAACGDGEHAWLFTIDGLIRVNYLTGEQDYPIRLDPSLSIWAMASPAANPEVLALVTGDGLVRAFDHGVALPARAGPMAFLPKLFYTTDGRLFACSGSQLREMRVEASGVREVRNLDAVGGGMPTFTEAAGRLFGPDGRVIDLATGQLVGMFPVNLADPELGVAMNSPTCCGDATLQSYDAITAEPLWQMPLPSVAVTLTLGTNGFLAAANDFYTHLPLGDFGNGLPDLALTANAPPTVAGTGFEATLEVSVTNRSNVAAHAVQLDIQLSPGLHFAAGQPGEGATHLVVPVGSLIMGTNVTFRLLAVAPGTQEIRVQTSSSPSDGTPQDNLQIVNVVVPDLPRVLVDDISVLEDVTSTAGQFFVRLSRPAPRPFQVPFTITPLTAQASDLRILSGTLNFTTGQTCAGVLLVQPDSTPEFDEAALVSLGPVPSAALARTNALLTILNDDFPILTVAGGPLREFDSGNVYLGSSVRLSASAPFPVECWIETGTGTAQPGLDYIPAGGWIVFGPGRTEASFSFPVIPDTVFEPSETIPIHVLAVRGGVPGQASAIITIQNDDPPPQPTLALALDGSGNVGLEFATLVGATYLVQTRTNFSAGTWTSLGSAVAGTGQVLRMDLGKPTRQSSFYRVKAQ